MGHFRFEQQMKKNVQIDFLLPAYRFSYDTEHSGHSGAD